MYVKQGHNITFLYESIVKNGGERLWGRLNYIYFEQGKPSLKLDTIQEITSGESAESFRVNSYFIDYLLSAHPNGSYSGYLASLRDAVIADLNQSFSKFMHCQITGKRSVFVDASPDGSKAEDIKSICSLLGGEIPDIEEIFQNACSAVPIERRYFTVMRLQCNVILPSCTARVS